MKRALLVGAVLLATTGAASAGTFLGLGIGPDANISGATNIESGGRSARLLGGYSFNSLFDSIRYLRKGTLAVEASLTGQSLYFKSSGGDFATKELGLAAKYNFPIGYHFEVFGKLGVHHTWLTHSENRYGSVYDTSGNGLLAGLGVEYRVSVGPIKAGSLFMDYTYYRANLEGDMYKFEGASVGMWMLGFTVGL